MEEKDLKITELCPLMSELLYGKDAEKLDRVTSSNSTTRAYMIFHKGHSDLVLYKIICEIETYIKILDLRYDFYMKLSYTCIDDVKEIFDHKLRAYEMLQFFKRKEKHYE